MSPSTDVAEFSFLSDMPQTKTRKTLVNQVKEFFDETDGGAIPVMLATKILKVNQSTIRKYIAKGKLRGFKFNETVLVSVKDVEDVLDDPRDKGGRPRKAG